jgi:peptide/nickel transport system substrate-binding protein
VLEVLVRKARRLGRSRHAGHRTAVRVSAAAALMGAAALVPAAITPAPAAGAGKVTFTVALTGDVDSFNPFNGIVAASYEMWALTYDYMIHYSMKNMSPEPGLAKSWETSSDGRTWTFHIRDGVKWSDGVPFTATDIAYTYNRIIDGGPEAATWSSYLTSVKKVTAPDASTVVLTLSKPNAVLPLLPIPIIPEHVWKNVSEKQVKSYSAEPKNGQPVVGEGPFRLVEGTAGGSTYKFEANPDYWQGSPHVDEVVFKVYKSDDPAVQALIKGEVDFVEDITPLQVKALQGKPGITAQNGISPGFDEIAFNTGAVDTSTGKPIGDGNPALEDPAFRHALGYALDLKQIAAKVYQGAAQPADTIIPTAYSQWRWAPPADQAFSFNLTKAGQELDAAGYKKGSDGLRTMPDGKPIGTLRLFGRTDDKKSVNTLNFFKEWLSQLGINSQVTAMDSNKLTDVILEGNFDAFQWGWYVEPDPDSMLSYLTCGQRGGWSDSWYCNPQYDKLYKQQNGEMNHTDRVAEVKKMQQIVFDDSPYLITAYTGYGEAVRSDRFACLEPQPDPGGVWLFQYGAHNYLSVRPADQAGNCDGVTSAVGATLPSKSTSDSGGSNTALVAGVAVLVVALAAGVFLAVRRRTTVAERE